MSFWASLYDFRNHPALALLTVAVCLLVALVVTLAAWQFFVRAAPLKCNGVWLPTSPGDCGGVEVDGPAIGGLPVGAILPFFGVDEDVPTNWVVCDGRDVPADSTIEVDANREKGGLQLPDLRNRFVRGADTSLGTAGIGVGGSDTIDFEHSHLWAEKRNGQWSSYWDREWRRVDDWGDGIGDKGTGNRPLSNDSDLTLYTDKQGSPVADNRPAYVELRYIIRVR